jgi:DNA-binding LytR/AlgR family response regulator
VEDESLVAMDMTDMLVRLGYDVLPAAMDYAEAIKALEAWEPGMVLIDINLGGGSSGMDVARHVAATKNIPFIFVSSHSDRQTVSAAASLEPSGYLLKPFDANDLYACMEVALAGFAARKGQGRKGDAALHDSIFIKADRHFVKVKMEDILYLESEHNYIFVHVLKGKYIVRSSFRKLLLNMPADRFMQVHKSFVVNLDRIDHFSHTDITINSREIPLSRMYKEDFFARMHRMQ